MAVVGPIQSDCIVIPIENINAFLSALTRLLAMTGSLPHHSHARQTTFRTPHATADLVYSVSYRLEQPIYPVGLRWSPHLLPILCTSV